MSAWRLVILAASDDQSCSSDDQHAESLTDRKLSTRYMQVRESTGFDLLRTNHAVSIQLRLPLLIFLVFIEMNSSMPVSKAARIGCLVLDSVRRGARLHLYRVKYVVWCYAIAGCPY